MQWRSKPRLVLLLAPILCVAGCSGRVSIESVNHNPARFQGKELSVSGRVANSFVEGSASAFELDDGTGRLWVLRDNTNLPTHNSSVRVRGTVEQGLPFAHRRFVIILRETSQR